MEIDLASLTLRFLARFQLLRESTQLYRPLRICRMIRVTFAASCSSNDFDILTKDVVVGRIMNVSTVPKDAPRV